VTLDPIKPYRDDEEPAMPARPDSTQRTLEDLVKRLRDADELVRLHAALTLGSLGEGGRPAVPLLADLLGSDHVLDRRAAAWGLRDLGAVAEEAVPALREALEDGDEQVADLAAQALEAIQGFDEEAPEEGPDGRAPGHAA
jgi:HEAT repeat protein